MLKEAGVAAPVQNLPPVSQFRPPSKEKTKVALWKRIPRWIYLGFSALGFAAVLVTLFQAYPWLSIQEGPRLDPRNELSQMFLIVNGGYIPLTHLDAVCVPNFAAGDTHGDVRIDAPFPFLGFADYIGHDGRVTIPCFRVLQIGKNVQMSQGTTLDVSVSYAFWALNFPRLRRTQVFRFKSVRGPDGTSQWEYLS